MPILMTLLVGGLAGVLVARVMNVNVDVFVAMAIGVIGALLGSVALRSLIGVFCSNLKRAVDFYRRCCGCNRSYCDLSLL